MNDSEESITQHLQLFFKKLTNIHAPIPLRPPIIRPMSETSKISASM